MRALNHPKRYTLYTFYIPDSSPALACLAHPHKLDPSPRVGHTYSLELSAYSRRTLEVRVATNAVVADSSPSPLYGYYG